MDRVFIPYSLAFEAFPYSSCHRYPIVKKHKSEPVYLQLIFFQFFDGCIMAPFKEVVKRLNCFYSLLFRN